MLPNRPDWLPLGALLIREGLLIHEELELALAEKERTGRRIGEILVEWGWVSSRAIARALAEQYQMEFVDLRKVEPDAAADQMLPERLAERFQALPIGLDAEGVLTVAISDPTDVGASDELRIAAGRPIHLVVADVAALEELMDRVYGGSVTA
jgi:hypothetical protein